jgi:hypothetical protein
MEYNDVTDQMSSIEERHRISDQIVALLKGADESVLSMVVDKLDIGVVTRHWVYMEDELLCDPIVWVEEDLEDCTMEQWGATRAYKTLHERSIEDGHETRQILEQWAMSGQ